MAERRMAREDEELDEYGLHKPAETWTKRMTDYVAPPEVLNSTDIPWYSQIGRALGAAPMALAGHFMDQLSPVDTRGDLHFPFPVLGEMAHGAEVNRYQQARREKEQEQRKREAEDLKLQNEWKLQKEHERSQKPGIEQSRSQQTGSQQSELESPFCGYID